VGATSRYGTPDLGAESRYGPTPAPPDDGGDRPTPVRATGREVHGWPSGDPRGRWQTQLPTAPPEVDAGGRPNGSDWLDRLPELLKVREVAAILRVGRNQLYEAVARGEVRAVRIGRTIRIPKTALLDLLTASPIRPGLAESPKKPPPGRSVR
jgi:excisionase family DNA binding protein